MNCTPDTVKNKKNKTLNTGELRVLAPELRFKKGEAETTGAQEDGGWDGGREIKGRLQEFNEHPQWE